MRKKAKLKEQKNQTNPETLQEKTQETTQETNQNQTQTQTSYNLEPDFDKLQEMKEELIQETLVESETQSDTEPKKRKGRRKKSEIEEISLPEIDFSILFDILIKRLPNPEPLTETEKVLVNNSANKVYQKYAGNFQYADEINLGLVLLAVIYPRLKKLSETSE